MKLTDLNATFWTHTHGRHGVGVTFDCPLCVKANVPDIRRALISVPFTNPVDGGPPEPAAKLTWARTGTTLEDLTLAPSLDASKHLHDHGPGWHGFVRNGQVQ